MKKLFFIAIAMAGILSVSAQKFTYNQLEVKTDFTLKLMKMIGISQDSTDVYNRDNYFITERAAKAYARSHGGGGGSTDTMPLHNQIITRVKYSDTSLMLANYRHWLQGYLKAADITGKTNNSDTASMLANYRHWLQGYLKANDSTALGWHGQIYYDNRYWKNIGNTGTDTAINFIGTLDNKDVIFKRNGIRSGMIGSFNTSFGNGALQFATPTMTDNSAFGENTLHKLSLGNSNTAVGAQALYNADGGAMKNAAFGAGSLYNVTTGSNNTGICFSAGQFATTQSHELYIGESNGVSYANDTSKTLVFGNTTPGVGRFKINGTFHLNNGTQGTGKVLTSDANGVATWQTPSGGGAVSDFNGRTGSITPTTGDYTKSMVGLSNVDNTSDASKPVSTAQQTALDLKANLASPTLTGTPNAPTATIGDSTTKVATTEYADRAAWLAARKAMADSIKRYYLTNSLGTFPLFYKKNDSTAKFVTLAEGTGMTITKTVDANGDTTYVLNSSGGGVSSFNSRTGAITPTTGDYTAVQVGLGNVDNTSDVNKPVSTAQQTALNLKANLASPTFTGTVSGITKSMVGLGSVDNTADASKTVASANNLTGGSGGTIPYQSAAGTTVQLANGTADQVLKSNGGTAAPSYQTLSTINGTAVTSGSPIGVSGASTTTYVGLSSAFSSTIITEATVTGWSFAVTAGKTYRVEVIGNFQTAATTTGGELGYFLTASGVGTIHGFVDGQIVSTAAATGLKQTISAIGAADLAGSNMITTGVTAINSPHNIYSIVIFNCTTSGTFNVGWATEVAASAAQINAGSALIYQTLN